MTQHRKTEAVPSAAATPERPLSARSVVASTLLGADPPVLPSRLLVRAAELFGISEGTTRVALSRMVAAGELESEGGAYRLAGPLLARQARQAASRRPRQRPWSGGWFVAVVDAERRDAAARGALRDAARQLKLAELREGVWLRPDNLDPERSPIAAGVVAAQCCVFHGATLEQVPGGPVTGERPGAAGLAGRLWDLTAWTNVAGELRTGLEQLGGRLAAGDSAVLAPAFVLSASVLRHLLADPLLPDELVPPSWPGVALREEYDRYDAAFEAAWRAWFRAQR